MTPAMLAVCERIVKAQEETIARFREARLLLGSPSEPEAETEHEHDADLRGPALGEQFEERQR